MTPRRSMITQKRIAMSASHGNKDLKESLAKERKAANSAVLSIRRINAMVRTVVERVNGRLKDDFGARHLRVRGHKKVYAHLMFGVLALCVDQIVRLLN